MNTASCKVENYGPNRLRDICNTRKFANKTEDMTENKLGGTSRKKTFTEENTYSDIRPARVWRSQEAEIKISLIIEINGREIIKRESTLGQSCKQ